MCVELLSNNEIQMCFFPNDLKFNMHVLYMCRPLEKIQEKISFVSFEIKYDKEKTCINLDLKNILNRHYIFNLLHNLLILYVVDGWRRHCLVSLDTKVQTLIMSHQIYNVYRRIIMHVDCMYGICIFYIHHMLTIP
jgi:hypothetical protein